MRLLTDEELEVLRTHHGNAYIVRDIRGRLYAADLKWCPQCDGILSLSSFAKNGKYLQRDCVSCEGKSRTRSYTRIGDTACKNSSRYRAAHPARICRQRKSLYERRKAIGMTGRQAAYKSTPPPHIQERWNAIKGNPYD